MSVAIIVTDTGARAVLQDAHLVGMDHIAHKHGVYELQDGDTIRFAPTENDQGKDNLKLA